MALRTVVAALLEELDQRSPAGYAVALHIRFTTPRYLFQTYPKRWMDQYSAAGLVAHDPTVRWGMENLGRIRWSALEAIDSAGVLDRARDFGIMNGVAVAVVGGGSRSIASFARADRDYDDREMDELHAVFGDLHRTTGGPEQLSANDEQALREMSIRLTH